MFFYLFVIKYIAFKVSSHYVPTKSACFFEFSPSLSICLDVGITMYKVSALLRRCKLFTIQDFFLFQQVMLFEPYAAYTRLLINSDSFSDGVLLKRTCIHTFGITDKICVTVCMQDKFESTSVGKNPWILLSECPIVCTGHNLLLLLTNDEPPVLAFVPIFL
ncbi:hypothetical protein AB205_0155630 [Aquarana catesbeiana]|uniref:Uncharacterized protein n=1 Tax=Aquarana catesbeiana TaxID=8400 RepID=A0A2G9RGP5_AQUCT|nr:hypothetical protein AB205_0155630 [Aquarana catesbeiana]